MAELRIRQERAAAAMARTEDQARAAALADSLRRKLAAAEAREAAAEERAAMAEERAAANAAATNSTAEGDEIRAKEDDEADGTKADDDSREIPSPSAEQPYFAYLPWLERLSDGDLDPLGDVEVLSALTEAGLAARASSERLDDLVEKRAWLKKLDAPMWCKAAIAVSDAASEAAEMAQLVAMCEAGDEVECRILSERKEETSVVLDKLNVADWGAAAAVLSAAALDMAEVTSTAFSALEAFGFRRHRSDAEIPGDEPEGDVEQA